MSSEKSALGSLEYTDGKGKRKTRLHYRRPFDMVSVSILRPSHKVSHHEVELPTRYLSPAKGRS